ncbi:MSMEG_6728 family protein [Streptomyces hoynatensis]|uniref:Cytoplasmic protein n=1 Tax=Streptomyces hoynatensis TaxID=1141874 RepID=A0A3A9YYW3_9ACTN|nr:MSMEG_6728 family protein [Streptomyces hoynatensis]RKN41203.1 cytoplasmic protein [Streptomyces hoynatensis]
MQTFLPYPDFAGSAAVLDARRLGKQRVEALQVLRGLTVPGYGWRHHPAVLMWCGYEEALVAYGLAVCRAWTGLGRRDTCAASLVAGFRASRARREVRDQPRLAAAGELPPWLGDAAFHRSHQSALVRKEPGFYGPRFPGVPGDLPYVWPRSDREAPGSRGPRA